MDVAPKNPKTLELGNQINEELNLNEIGAEIWDELNPLLKQANDAMVKCGINPEDFYG